MARRALVVGYGNPLRRDDAVGQVAAQAFADDVGCAVDVVQCHQLAPELAEHVARVDRVVFVDAIADGAPGSISVSQLQTVPPQQTASLGHHVDPRQLLLLAGELFGHSPEAFLVAVGAGDLELGEGLSSAVSAALPDVIATVRRLLGSYTGSGA